MLVRRVLLVVSALVAIGAGAVAAALGYESYADCLEEDSSTCGSSALEDAAPYVVLAAVAVMVFVLLIIDLVGARRRRRVR